MRLPVQLQRAMAAEAEAAREARAKVGLSVCLVTIICLVYHVYLYWRCVYKCIHFSDKFSFGTIMVVCYM